VNVAMSEILCNLLPPGHATTSIDKLTSGSQEISHMRKFINGPVCAELVGKLRGVLQTANPALTIIVSKPTEDYDNLPYDPFTMTISWTAK
jgi:hypothetical protein